MTKVDFYILKDSGIEQRHLFACRLAEKAYKLGHQVYIHSDDEAQANAIDQLLWSYRPGSFIPHHLEADGSSPNPLPTIPAVQVGFEHGQGSSATLNGLLINLSDQVPTFFSRFERVSEVVIQEPGITAATREHYRFYRDRGYALQNHDLRQ